MSDATIVLNLDVDLENIESVLDAIMNVASIHGGVDEMSVGVEVDEDLGKIDGSSIDICMSNMKGEGKRRRFDISTESGLNKAKEHFIKKVTTILLDRTDYCQLGIEDFTRNINGYKKAMDAMEKTVSKDNP